MNELKDIKIGPKSNDWIEWIEFDSKQSEMIEIDSLILEQKEFWDKLETQCVKDCCGFDAYSFYPKSIRNAKSGIPNLDVYFKDFITYLNTSESTVLITEYMNQLVHKSTFLKLLDHIKLIK